MNDLKLFLLVPFVVALVSFCVYLSFKAWVFAIVFALQRAQAWGWWP